MRVRPRRDHPQNPAMAERLQRILDQIIESLLELIRIRRNGRQAFGQFLLHDDVAVPDLRLEEGKRFMQRGVDADQAARSMRGPHRAEELVDDGVEAADLAPRDLHRFQQFLVGHVPQSSPQIALEQLQVDVEGIERIA